MIKQDVQGSHVKLGPSKYFRAQKLEDKGLSSNHRENSFSPLQWLRGKINPENREKQTKEEIAEAKKQVTEAQSIFEAQPAALEKSVKERKERKDWVSSNKRTCDKFVRAKEVSPQFYFSVLPRSNWSTA